MANIAPIISEHKALEVPRLTAKAPRKFELEFLKTPPQAAALEQPIDAPSELHFTQWGGGANYFFDDLRFRRFNFNIKMF